MSENTAITLSGGGWRPGKGYRLHLLILKDDENSYSAVALNLPGAGSCGDSIEEAVENAKEAISGVLEEYNSSGVPIPWKDSSAVEIPLGAIQKWIIIDG
jgi:predicted RNase H-like HicB family nuclease